MSEWMAVEAIIRQKDRETMAANLAKLSSESTSGGDAPPPPTPNTSKVLSQELSNDVSNYLCIKTWLLLKYNLEIIN